MPLTGLPGPAAAAIAPTPCRQLAPIVWMGPGKTRREDAWTSRRGFLRTIGLAAGPLLIPASALGRTGRPAPADRLNLGVIGLGMMGQGHVSNCLNLPSVQLVAVCDVDRTRLEDVRRLVDSSYAVATHSGEYQGCSAYADFRELLARDDLDAVWVATPDHWHALITIAAVQAGKDVYCEKPLSLTVPEAREMVRAARRYDRVVQTGSQQRSMATFRLAVELVRSGRIGSLLSCHVNIGGPSGECYLPAQPVPPGLDWDMWLGPAAWRPYHSDLHPWGWRWFRDYSGGAMTDWGAHHFDICQWALGMDHSGPVEVTPPDGKDVRWLTYRYANGVLVQRGGYTGTGSGITFHGTEGFVEVSRTHIRTEPRALLRQRIGPGDAGLYCSQDHVENWLACIRSRARPVCDVEVGCRSATVCHLGNIAYWLKRPLRWDPQTEQIVGDPEANRWLDRPKRAPWRLG